VDLAAAPAVPPPDETSLSGSHPLDGATVANLSPALAEELSLDETWSGVVVVGVKRGSVAARLRLGPGDILLRLNDEEIDRVDPLRRLLRRDASRWRISIRRGGDVRTLVVG
jgi:serine protease Do